MGGVAEELDRLGPDRMAIAERRAAMGEAARASVAAKVPSWREVLCQDLLPVWQAAAATPQ